jgi:hypothetical protein
MPKRRKTGSFRATGSDGRTYKVVIYTMFVDASDSTGPDEIAVSAVFATDDGRSVVGLEKGKYVIRNTNIFLTPTGPMPV